METDPAFAEQFKAKRRVNQQASLDKKRLDPEWVARKREIGRKNWMDSKKAKIACKKAPPKRAVVKPIEVVRPPVDVPVSTRKIILPPTPPIAAYVQIPGIPWSGLTLAQLVEKGYAKLDAVAPIAKLTDSPLIATN